MSYLDSVNTSRFLAITLNIIFTKNEAVVGSLARFSEQSYFTDDYFTEI